MVDCPEATSQTVSIQPNEGFKIKEVKIDGQSVGREQLHHFENVQQNHTIEVIFEEGDDYFDLPFDSTILSVVTAVENGFNEKNKIRVFPNPTDSQITISGLYKNSEIFIYDMMGKTVLNFNGKSNEETISVSNLKNGIYVLRVLDNVAAYSTALIVK
jgi:hypothetical protein